MMNQSQSNRGKEEETNLLIPNADNTHSDVVLDIEQATLNPPVAPKDIQTSVGCRDVPEPPCPYEESSPSLTEGASASAAEMSKEAEFLVGKDRQLMIGCKSELALISPVFRTMFSQAKSESKKQTVVEIPDVQTQSFGVILRCAAKDTEFQLSDDIVWNVLQAADQFQVLPVVSRCFHYLLHRHSQRHKSRHLCMALEKAHQLGYREHRAKCLYRVQRQAGNVFSSASALSELCHQCMLQLVMADHLPVPEILVHDAVVTWARAALRKNSAGTQPNWEELRAVAGQLVYHVRYLAMPRPTLQGLRAGEPGCLLRETEKMLLLEGHVACFPKQVATPRQNKELCKKRLHDLFLKLRERKALLFLLICCVLVSLLGFLLVYFCFLTDESESSAAQESPVYILMFQEEQ